MIYNYVTFNPKIHKFEPMRKVTEKLVRLDEKHPFDLIKRIGKIDKQKKFVRVASGSTPPPNDPLDIYKKPFNKAVNNIITYVVNTCKKF